jgi:hypothetical protein
MVVSPKDPPSGTSPALGLLPCRSVRYAAFVSGGCPRVPTEAMGWTVGTRGTIYLGRVHDLPTKTRGKPDARMAHSGRLVPKRRSWPSQMPGTAGPASIPWVTAAAHVGSWSRLAGLAVPVVGHAQQDLQLLGAAAGGQDLVGGFQPAQHDHG